MFLIDRWTGLRLVEQAIVNNKDLQRSQRDHRVLDHRSAEGREGREEWSLRMNIRRADDFDPTSAMYGVMSRPETG